MIINWRKPTSNVSMSVAMGLLVSCLIAPVAAQKADTIVPKNGSNYRGRISKVSPTTLTVNIKGKDQEISVYEISHVIFGDESSYMRQARDAMDDGQFDQAAQRLERVEPDKLKSESKQEFAYLQARLKIERAARGEVPASVGAKAAIDFLRVHKESFHYFEVLESLGRLAMQMGSHDKAARYFVQLAKAPWPETKMSAGVQAGNAFRNQGKSQYAEAIKRYDSVLNTRATNPEMKRQQGFALAGKAACQSEMGNAESAIAALEKLVAETDTTDVELQASVNNALGDCFQAAGKNTDAALAYLHTHLLFFKDSAAHAEALYKLTLVWGKLGKPADASRARDLLKARYGNTAWAKR